MSDTIPGKNSPDLPGFGNPLRIIFLVLSAIAGLWLSARLIYNSDKYGQPRFHEIQWNAKEITDSLVSWAIAHPDTIILDSGHRVKQDSALRKIKYWLARKTDSAVNAELTRRSGLFIRPEALALENYRFACREDTSRKGAAAVTYIDTILVSYPGMVALDSSTMIASPGSTVLNSSIRPDHPDNDALGSSIPVTYTDSNLVNGQITGPVILKIKRYKAINRFFNKYPGFGLWSLMLIIQSVFYFLLVTGFFFHFTSDSANSLYKQYLQYNRKTFYLLAAGMVVFLLVIYFALLNTPGQPPMPANIMFMRTVEKVFTLVSVAGYLAAAFCLVGMISSVIYMNQLKEKTKTGIAAAATEELRTEIKRRFNAYFVFVAIILTLAIFTTGVYFSSLNSLDFIKQVRKDLGYSPVNPDLVYLYGILNSFFLVIVYLPLRYIMNSIDKSIPLPAAAVPADPAAPPLKTEPPKSPSLAALSKMLSGVTEVLIAASPFLASLLQQLLNSIFT